MEVEGAGKVGQLNPVLFLSALDPREGLPGKILGNLCGFLETE